MMNRRTFLAALGAAAATPRYLRAAMSSFNLSVLTDEISQDFGHACEVAAKEFGMGFVDLREAGGKNLMKWDAAQIADVQRVLERFKLRVACLATPIFKVDWPGAPRSPFSPKRDEFGADFTYKDQDQLLEHAFELAKAFNTDRIRIFDFWRLEDQKPHRAAIDDVVRAAAAKAAKRGVTLVLENEYACNTATGAEAGRLLTAIPDKALADHLGSGQRAVPRRVAVSRRLREDREGAHRPRALQGRGEGRRRQVGVEGDGDRRHRLGGTVPRAEEPTAIAMPSRSKRTGAAPARRKSPRVRASPG